LGKLNLQKTFIIKKKVKKESWPAKGFVGREELTVAGEG